MAAALHVLSVRVIVAASDRRELVQALLAWLSAVRLLPGFAGGHAAEDLEVPDAYAFWSIWRRREDLDAHLSGSEFGVLLGALEVLGRDTHVLVTTALDGAEDGLTYVRQLRGRAHALPETAGYSTHPPTS